MKTALKVLAALAVGIGCLGFASNEFAAQIDTFPAVVIRPLVVPSPPPPSPLARANYLLKAYGIVGQQAPEPPAGYRVWGAVVARVTAYEPSEVSCGNSADGKTSTLRNAWRLDGCAVAPDAIPYGTLAWIPGVGWRVADDTGTAMRRAWRAKQEYHIDIRVATVSRARQWGTQRIPVMLCIPDKVGQ